MALVMLFAMLPVETHAAGNSSCGTCSGTGTVQQLCNVSGCATCGGDGSYMERCPCSHPSYWACSCNCHNNIPKGYLSQKHYMTVPCPDCCIAGHTYTAFEDGDASGHYAKCGICGAVDAA